MILLDGKTVSQAVKQRLRSVADTLTAEGRRAPHLAALLVGHNGASETYIASKIKGCEETGFQSTLVRLPENVTETELTEAIQKLNNDSGIDGILVQLPLPAHIDEQRILSLIDPAKDVDGFHPASAGKLMLGLPSFIPATPLGILMILDHYEIPTSGRHAVIIGRSHIVGRPLSVLLSQNRPQGNCTVTVCHSRSENLNALCRQADILVAALGQPGFVTADMVKPEAVVIDVGITRVPDPTRKSGYAIRGDVDFDQVAPLCSHITPVPGGVGLMTIAALLSNTLTAYQQRNPS